MYRNISRIKYFVFASGKTGSQTLNKSLRRRFGNNLVLHVHSNNQFQKAYENGVHIKDVILNCSKNFNKIYIIDSYREPFERGISSFFQNIDDHCPNWQNMSTDEVIEYFNNNKLYLLDLYHSYLESWAYFNISTDVTFDFDNGYIKREFGNLVFIKTRLKESYRWDKIFSEIFGDPISFNHENDSSKKIYNNLYTDFKKKYKLPETVKNQFLSVVENKTYDYDTRPLFNMSWSEMKKFMTESEIEEYLKKWIY
jgi:hypothetical protein